MSLKYRYVIGVYKIKIKLQFVALGGAASCAKWRPHPSESKLHTPYYASACLPRSPLLKFSQMKSQNNQHPDFPILISFMQKIAHMAPVRTVQTAFHRTKYVHYFITDYQLIRIISNNNTQKTIGSNIIVALVVWQCVYIFRRIIFNLSPTALGQPCCLFVCLFIFLFNLGDGVTISW